MKQEVSRKVSIPKPKLDEAERRPVQPEPEAVDGAAVDDFDMGRSARTGLSIDWWAVILAVTLGLLVWSKLLPAIPW